MAKKGFQNTSGTSIIEPPRMEQEVLSPKEQCKKDGKFWDEKTQTCLAFKKEEKEVKKVNVDQKDIEIGQTQNDSKETIKLPDGRQFFGLNKEDVAGFTEDQSREKARLEGTSPLGTAQAQAEEQARLQQALGNIGQVGTLTPAQEAEINYSQAATAGLAGVIPGILGGATAGAIAGAPVGGIGAIPGAIGGAIVGGIGTFTGGIISNIKEQQKGELQAADIELSTAKTSMRQLAMLASRDPANADVYISQFNKQLTRVYQARRQTAAETSGDLNAWIEDGREQLADFDAFLNKGGIADIYAQKLSTSLQTGVPLSEYGDELI